MCPSWLEELGLEGPEAREVEEDEGTTEILEPFLRRKPSD